MRPQTITNWVLGFHRFAAQVNYPLQKETTFYGAATQDLLRIIIEPCDKGIVAIWKIKPKNN